MTRLDALYWLVTVYGAVATLVACAGWDRVLELTFRHAPLGEPAAPAAPARDARGRFTRARLSSPPA